jgi:hypothetical protein
MGGPVCFGEIGLREMRAYDREQHQGWHRDKPHWTDHPDTETRAFYGVLNDRTRLFLAAYPEAVS